MTKSVLLVVGLGILFGSGQVESYFDGSAANSRRLGVRRRRFLLAFGSSWIAGLLLCFGFAVYVNPWGNYGEIGCHHEYNARKAKTIVLGELAKTEFPQALVLGSSNVMRLRPAAVEAELGLTAFNCGVFYGRAEDYLCFVRYITEDLGQRPRLLLVGLDSWTLGPAGGPHEFLNGARRNLLNTPSLVRHLPGVYRGQILWSKLIDGFSRQQLMLGLRKLRAGVRRHRIEALGESWITNQDGTRKYFGNAYGNVEGNVFASVEARTFPITEHLTRVLKEKGPEGFVNFKHYDFDAFNPGRVGYLRETVALCQRQGVELVFFLNPVHPVFREVVAQETQFLRHIANLRTLIEALETEFSVVRGLVDGQTIPGLDPLGYYDELHPDTANGDLLIQAISRHLDGQ